MLRLKVLEKDVQRQVLDYLSLRKVWHRRLNSGAALLEAGGNGKPRRFIRYGAPGLPDILARTKAGTVIWIEVKSSTGKLSPDQAAWKKDSEAFGDTFITARCLEDVRALFEGVKDA